MKKYIVFITAFIYFCMFSQFYIFAEIIEYTGMTKPLKDSTINSTVQGRIAAIFHKEGDFVKKGDVILELEKNEQEFELTRRKLIFDSKIELEAAEQQSKTKKRDYEAAQKVYDATKSISEEEIWKKELDYRLAELEYERLKVSEDREYLEYKIAETQRDQRIIKAPFDGVIVKINLEVGESCDIRDNLIRIVDLSKCLFIVYVKSGTAIKVKQLQKVTLKIERAGRCPLVIKGIVDYVSPVVDVSSGLREIKIIFDNPNNQIKPGVTGTTNLS